MQVVGVVRARGGACPTRSLAASVLPEALRRGLLTEPMPGVAALPGIPDPLVLAASVGGAASCAWAAAQHRLETLRPPAGCITVPREGGYEHLERGVPRLHRRDVAVDGLVTVLPRTVADCARCLPALEAVVVVDAALRRGVPTDLVLHHLRGRGAAAPRQVVARGDARSGSVGETVARILFWVAGIAAVPQHHVPGVGYVDFLVGRRVVVEVDGFEFHASQHDFARDRRRDALLVAAGYVVLRFTHLDVLHRPEAVRAAVRAALRRHG